MSLQSLPHSIADNVGAIRRRIDDAARGAGRDPKSVHLIAVSKRQPAPLIRAAVLAGCTDIGESYVQEAVAKIDALADLPVVWHFIGRIQSNKTRTIAERFDWVHTVARVNIAERLSTQCPPGKTLDVTLQVNVDSDPAKAGVSPDAAGQLLDAAQELPNLRVRGLMTILERSAPPLEGYRRLAELFDALASRARGPWDVLSMGMSGDFDAAIAAGATHVRIGTALFGSRP